MQRKKMLKKVSLIVLMTVLGVQTLHAEKGEQAKTVQAKKDASKLSRWQSKGEVVTDTKLGLTWQDNSAVKNTKKKWKAAKEYCQNLSLEGYNDWRLPSYNELLTIVDYDKYDPAIIPSFKNASSSDFYWSSSVYVPFDKTAWIVHFEDGSTHTGYKIYKYSVRCVRGRQ